MTPMVLGRRALRAFAPLVLMLAIVTVALAVVATAIPRSVNGFLTEGLRYDAAATSSISRDLLSQGTADFDFGAGAGEGMSSGASGVWGLLDEQLETLRASQPQPLRDTLGRADFTVVTAPESFSLTAPTAVSLGYDPRFLSRVTIVEGVEPAPGPTTVPGDAPIEVIASQPVATDLAWSVGETRPLYLGDRLEQTITLVGVFEANDPDDAYWEHTTSTLSTTMDKRTLPPRITGTVFANAVGFEPLLEYPAPFAPRSSVWYPVATDSLNASTAPQLAQQVRKFVSTTQQVASRAHATLPFRSNLPDVLEDAQARATSSQAILATILAGPIGLAVAIEVLVARLAAARLRTSLALLRARGASAAQRRLLLAIPALVIGVIATLVGVLLALFIAGGEIGGAGALAIVATAVAPAALLVLFGAGPERAGDGAAGSGPVGAARVRLIGEAVVALATVVSLVSVVQRGNNTTPGGAVDHVAAAVPLLLSLLGCIVTLRIYPIVLRRSLNAAHRSSGVGAFLGLARALRAGSAGLVPVVAVLIGVSVAVFSGVLSATLVSGTQIAAEARVGADLAVDNVRLDPADLDEIRAIDGVAVAAGVSRDLFHDLEPENVTKFPVTLVLVDPNDFAAVQRGVPGALELPRDLAARSDGVVPLAVSKGVADVVGADASGDDSGSAEAPASLDFADVTLLAPALQTEIFNTSQNWVIGDLKNAEALDYPSPVVANQVLVKLVPGASVVSVRSAIVDIVGADAELSTASDITAIRSANPAVGGIRAATVLAIIGSVVLSAAALALTTVLDGRSRRRSLALLGTLGLGRRQARGTVAWELAPLSIVGLVIGVLLGAVLSGVVLASVNLRPFTSGLDQPAVTLDPLLLVSIIGGFVLLLVGAVAAGAWQATRPSRTPAAADTGWNP